MKQNFDTLVDSFKGNVKAVVTTANPLSAAENKSVVSALEKLVEKGQKLTVESKIDESIIGGIIVQIGDQSLDLSVASRIENLRQTVLQWSQ